MTYSKSGKIFIKMILDTFRLNGSLIEVDEHEYSRWVQNGRKVKVCL